MKFTLPMAKQKARAPLLLLMLSGMLAGCGSSESASGSAAGNTPAKKAAASGTPEAAIPVEPRLSVFNPAPRDPFYPHLKKAEAKSVAATSDKPGVPGDVKSFLTAGFQGIVGTPERRMAMIHNTILEPRRSAVITARLAGKEHRVALRCLDVAWDSVTVQVEGQPFPITINHQVKPKL